jgi:hypothetical protein
MIAGVFDEVFGVPTHPLAVHAPVVLVPIGAVVAVALAVKSDWRRRIWWAMPVGVFFLVVLLFIAKQSGEALEETGNVLGDVDEHIELADTTFVMGIVWFVATVGLAVRDWMLRAPRPLSADSAPVPRDMVSSGLRVLVSVLAVLTMIWLIRTGHAGAASRWNS